MVRHEGSLVNAYMSYIVKMLPPVSKNLQLFTCSGLPVEDPFPSASKCNSNCNLTSVADLLYVGTFF